MAVKSVRISSRARKDLRKVPLYIVDKLDTWIDAVERDGLEEVRKIRGYHDEPLKGDRLGQRSIRLSKSYRAIYKQRNDEELQFVRIEEVSKHAY
jgi:proteic killer suppression protein